MKESIVGMLAGSVFLFGIFFCVRVHGENKEIKEEKIHSNYTYLEDTTDIELKHCYDE